MLLGSLTSLLAGVWKFMAQGGQQPETLPFNRLYSLAERIKVARNDAELMDIEQTIDELLKDELKRSARGDPDAADIAALGLTTHRLEHLLDQRRSLLKAAPRSALSVV